MFLYAFTILVSAFLLFQVQPVIAKIILPWFGGSAAVWTVCLLSSNWRCWPVIFTLMRWSDTSSRMCRVWCMRCFW